jgi:hypothetical protein
MKAARSLPSERRLRLLLRECADRLENAYGAIEDEFGVSQAGQVDERRFVARLRNLASKRRLPKPRAKCRPSKTKSDRAASPPMHPNCRCTGGARMSDQTKDALGVAARAVFEGMSGPPMLQGRAGLIDELRRAAVVDATEEAVAILRDHFDKDAAVRLALLSLRLARGET